MGNPITPGRAAVALALFQAADAAACATKQPGIVEALDRVDCPEPVRAVLPFVKGASAAGLLLGFKVPWLGRLAAILLVPYFAIAIGFHVKAKDRADRSIPPVLIGAWAAWVARTAYPAKA